MDKKTMVLKILDQLSPIRNLAEGLKIVVQEGNLEENILEALITILGQSIHGVKTEKERKAFEKGRNILERIKKMEEDEKSDEIELDLDLFD